MERERVSKRHKERGEIENDKGQIMWSTPYPVSNRINRLVSLSSFC